MSTAGSYSDSEPSSKPRVEGTVTTDGKVLCTCGKKCGQAYDGVVEFTCRCGNRVSIDSDILFLRACQTGIESINNIINKMASKQRSAA